MTVNILDIRVVNGPTHGGLVTDGVVVVDGNIVITFTTWDIDDHPFTTFDRR